MRVIPKQSRSQAKINLILETTISLITRDGADAVTMSDIASASELPIATLYHYFPNKNEILKTLAEIAIDDIDQALTEAIRSAASSDNDWMALVDFVFESYSEAPGLVPLFQAIKAIPDLRSVVDHSNERVAVVLSESIDPDSRLTPERRARVCRLISEIVQSTLEYALTQCEEKDRPAVAEELKEILGVLYSHYFG